MAGSSKRKRKKQPKPSRQQPSPSFWDSLSDRNKHIVVLAVLTVIALGFFAPVNFQGKRIVGGDTRQARAMASSMVDYQEQTGDVGLWSPNLFSGMPGYFISYWPEVVQPDIVVWNLRKVAYPTFQFLLLVIGIYVLVYVLVREQLAALIAAVAAGLTTYIPIILYAGHSSKFIALSWVPWILLAFVYVLRKPGAITGLLFAAAMALGLRSGHAQITYNLFFLIGIWWIAEAIGAAKQKNLSTFAQSTGWLVLGTVLALLMVAQPYLPQYEFKQFSIRGAAGVPVPGSTAGAGSGAGLGWDYAMNWSQGRLELLTYLIANALGGGPDAYWGDKPFTEGPHYLGGIVLALALFAVLADRSRTTRAIAVGVGVITLLALGKNAAFINRLFFDHVPFFNSFRAPEIWLHMAEIGTAILAGIGAARLVESKRSQDAERKAWYAFGGFLVLTILLFLAAPSILSFEVEGEHQNLSLRVAAQNNTSPDNPQVRQAVDQYLGQLKDERVSRFRSDAGRTALLLVLATLALFFYFAGKMPSMIVLAFIALLTLGDLWTVGNRHLSSEDYVLGSVDDHIAKYGFDQFVQTQIDEAGGAGHFRTLSLESSPTQWARAAAYYEISGGYHAAKLRLYQDLIDHLGLGDRGTPPNKTMLDLTGTRFIVARQPLPSTNVVYTDETGLSVLERVDAAPRTHFVDNVEVVANGAAAIEALKNPNFDRRDVAVVLSDPGELGVIDSTATADVELIGYSAHEAMWRVNTDSRRLLVTSEVFYPAGWTATIDGDMTEILQTNHAFRSVVVPEGEHVVRMQFSPEAHRIGVLISLIATILVYGALAILVGLHFARQRKIAATG